MNLLYKQIISKKQISETEQEKIKKLNLNNKFINKHLNLSKTLGYSSQFVLSNKSPYDKQIHIQENLYQMLGDSSFHINSNIIKQYFSQFYKVIQ